MWFLFACLSGLLFTWHGLMMRYVLKGTGKDAWAFSFYFSGISALICLPFALIDFKIDSGFFPWALILTVCLLIVLNNFLVFEASKVLSPSIVGTLTKLRLVLIFILGITLLQEPFTWAKTIGTALTILASLVIINKNQMSGSLKGVVYVLIAAVCNASIVILFKYLTDDFNAQTLTFLIFFLPAILNFLLMPRAKSRIIKYGKTSKVPLVIACAFGALANLALIYALAVGEASRIVIITEAFLIITLVGEHFLLKEKSNVYLKLLAVLLAVAGAVLLTI